MSSCVPSPSCFPFPWLPSLCINKHVSFQLACFCLCSLSRVFLVLLCSQVAFLFPWFGLCCNKPSSFAPSCQPLSLRFGFLLCLISTICSLVDLWSTLCFCLFLPALLPPPLKTRSEPCSYDQLLICPQSSIINQELAYGVPKTEPDLNAQPQDPNYSNSVPEGTGGKVNLPADSGIVSSQGKRQHSWSY